MKNVKRRRIVLVLGVIGMVMFSCHGGCVQKKGAIDDLSQFDFQHGDIVLQHLPGRLCSVIADVTDSQYSHCGIVVRLKGDLYVLEAIGPVRFTRLIWWLNRGIRNRFTQLRPKGLSADQIASAIAEAEKLLRLPYDIQYELDEEKIYCSELVYKAFQRGCGIEIGEKQPLKDLNWKPHEDFIRYLADGELPLERPIVTPESLTRSPHVELVYSTFLPRTDEPTYDTAVLEGTWRGEYTIRGLRKATGELVLVRRGSSIQFESGAIWTGKSNLIATIESVSVPRFSKKRTFSATLADSRGITATLNAHIRDEGTKIIGTWKDNLGFRGIFSFRKRDLRE